MDYLADDERLDSYYNDTCCETCDDVEGTIATCRRAVKILFKQLYLNETVDLEAINSSMEDLVSFLDVIDQWPKDENGKYIQLNIKQK